MKPDKQYPLFNYSPHYLQCRNGKGLMGIMKRWRERCAIAHCLRAIPSDVTITSVCDIPCGCGRLFPYWKKCGWRVEGIDFSDSMVTEATAQHTSLGLDGDVRRDDAFAFHVSAPFDLLACVRFIYYFDADERVTLLRHFATQARRYLLLQYHTLETIRGRRNASRNSRHYLTHAEITAEIKNAGMVCQRIEPISIYSDRAYVLAELGTTP